MKISMIVRHLLVELALVMMESTTSLVIVLDLDTLEDSVMWTLMNVKLKNLVILMLLVLTTKDHTSVTVNQDLMERTVTKILMTVEATPVKMEVCLVYIMTNKVDMKDAVFVLITSCIVIYLLASLLYLLI